MLRKDDRTLALDLGGTSVKAAIFAGDSLERETHWHHDYKDCGYEKARDHLLREASLFAGGNVDRIGLSVAGLIASDESLFRSTVLTSFEDRRIGDLLKSALGASTVSVDNDADCGAVGEFHFARHELFYVVSGSGVGSQYVDDAGRIKYLVRINKALPFSDEMNHTISDVGLRISIPREKLYEIFHGYGIKQQVVDQVLKPENRSDGKGLQEEGDSIRSGRLASAMGVRNILEILWNGNFYQEGVGAYYGDRLKECGSRVLSLDDLYSNRRAGKVIAHLARVGDQHAANAYEIMGVFLGMVISEAQKILLSDLGRCPGVHLGGQIMAAGDLFLRQTRETIARNEVDCRCVLSKAFELGRNANLWGAYLCAAMRETRAGDSGAAA